MGLVLHETLGASQMSSADPCPVLYARDRLGSAEALGGAVSPKKGSIGRLGVHITCAFHCKAALSEAPSVA
jgi:hypothetical protein